MEDGPKIFFMALFFVVLLFAVWLIAEGVSH